MTEHIKSNRVRPTGKGKNLVKKITVSTLGFSLLTTISCQRSSTSSPDLRTDMLDAYSASEKLFPYVWRPSMFNDPSSEKTIQALLDRLASDFHKAEGSGSQYAGDPGFTIALTMQQELLTDIRLRFKEGKKDYANWKLRSVTGNCVACHTRYKVRNDFLGAAPLPVSTSYQDQLAAADFLLATRQFDNAAEAYLTLATTVGSVAAGSAGALPALKQWLVIQVRVKNQGKAAASALEAAALKLRLPENKQRIIQQWITDLRIPLPNDAKSNPLATAARLLGTDTEPTLEESEMMLVPSLRATAVLHNFLESAPAGEERRKAQYLLAFAYARIPIHSFEALRELYLEQCIRENAGTAEAKSAYALYAQLVEEESTGSGGVHLDQETRSKLTELNGIAFGSAP
jgi:hypothetical protein